MELKEKEYNKLCEVLSHLEEQFDNDLDALAEAFNIDDNGVDIEVKLNDDTSEQYYLNMEELISDKDAEELAGEL